MLLLHSWQWTLRATLFPNAACQPLDVSAAPVLVQKGTEAKLVGCSVHTVRWRPLIIIHEGVPGAENRGIFPLTPTTSLCLTNNEQPRHTAPPQKMAKLFRIKYYIKKYLLNAASNVIIFWLKKLLWKRYILQNMFPKQTRYLWNYRGQI